MTDLEARVLELAQEGLPLVPRPFLALAEQLGVSEGEVIATLRQLQEEGLIRELSGFFDPRKLGYVSTLACLRVPEERLEAVAALLEDLPEVTHNYLRDHEQNLWFTVIAPSVEACERLLERVGSESGCGPVHSLPAQQVFKIRVSFRAEDLAP